MNLREQMWLANEVHHQDAIVVAAKLREAASGRLFAIIRKKLQTTLIGSLSRFEMHFGSLWGHGKPLDQCTDAEKQWREYWDICRTEVLNNGNNQLRALEKEQAQYSVEWLRYRTTLPVKGK